MSEGTGPQQIWREALAVGRLMLQRSRSSGEFVFYPRVVAPRTGAADLEWLEASGRGVVHATTIVRKRPPEPSYSVVLVDLEEGPRLMSEVVDIPPDDVKIGMPVQARIDMSDGQPRLVFVTVGDFGRG